MFSHGDGPTGQPGRVENDRREYREYRKFLYVSPCDARPLEDDLAGTSGVAEIAENKFYVAWSAPAMHIMPAPGRWVHAAARLRGREGRG